MRIVTLEEHFAVPELSGQIDPEVIAPELGPAGIVVLEAMVLEAAVLEAAVTVAVAVGPVLEITVVGPVVPVHRGLRG